MIDFNLRKLRGLIHRYICKHILHKYDVMIDGVSIFTDYADIYGKSINNTHIAEKFFTDFLADTKGLVIVDHLDADNDDHIETVDFDHNNGLMRICTRIPEKDPEIKLMRQMVLPYDTYSILVKLKSIRFVRVKHNKCLGIVINGYTFNKKEVIKALGRNGYTIKADSDKGSFFSIEVIREKNGEYEFIRAMNTPITSFWLIPKHIGLTAQDSEQLLYAYNQDALSNSLSFIWKDLGKRLHHTKDKEHQERYIKECGNGMRDIAEGFFKLVMCFYHEKYHYDADDYNNRLLGDLTSPLKKTVYTTADDATRINTITRVANEFSHDTGFSVDITKLGEMYMWLLYYISDFKNKISYMDNKWKPEPTLKPSPADFIEKNLKSWNFSKEISKLRRHTPNLHFLLKVHPLFYFVDLFSTKGDYLCKDGIVRTLNKDDLSKALELTSREDVIELVTEINNVVKTECVAKGYDGDSAFLNFSFIMIGRSKPTHLFTLDEIKDLMRNADDDKNNTLVIDELGYAHIVNNYKEQLLYPVSQETWCAGNRYVGKDSTLSDAEPSYHLCLKLWLEYLQTGDRQFDDYYPIIDVDKTIEEIKKYY